MAPAAQGVGEARFFCQSSLQVRLIEAFAELFEHWDIGVFRPLVERIQGTLERAPRRAMPAGRPSLPRVSGPYQLRSPPDRTSVRTSMTLPPLERKQVISSRTEVGGTNEHSNRAGEPSMTMSDKSRAYRTCCNGKTPPIFGEAFPQRGPGTSIGHQVISPPARTSLRTSIGLAPWMEWNSSRPGPSPVCDSGPHGFFCESRRGEIKGGVMWSFPIFS